MLYIIGGNNCGDEGCKYFGDMLMENKKITTLHLGIIFICLNCDIHYYLFV